MKKNNKGKGHSQRISTAYTARGKLGSRSLFFGFNFLCLLHMLFRNKVRKFM